MNWNDFFRTVVKATLICFGLVLIAMLCNVAYLYIVIGVIGKSMGY